MNVNPNGLPSNYAAPKAGGVRKQEPLQEALLPPINIVDKAPEEGTTPPTQERSIHFKFFKWDVCGEYNKIDGKFYIDIN